MMPLNKLSVSNNTKLAIFYIKSYLLFRIFITPKSCTGNCFPIFRDLKPENMMYDKETKIIKLIDFGPSVRFDSSDPIPRRCVGTVSFFLF
jgi:serine/threonine protein kinase